jgi:NAD-dependent dihydropyrimidine dehydrogenase PreA subunit
MVKINIFAHRCKGCKFCIELCPKGTLKESIHLNSQGIHVPEVGDINECIGCQLCQNICPDFAIWVTER